VDVIECPDRKMAGINIKLITYHIAGSAQSSCMKCPTLRKTRKMFSYYIENNVLLRFSALFGGKVKTFE